MNLFWITHPTLYIVWCIVQKRMAKNHNYVILYHFLAINEHDSSTSESVTGSVDSVQRMPDLVPEMNVNGNGNNSSPNGSDDANNKSKVYASVSEMKRMKVFSRNYNYELLIFYIPIKIVSYLHDIFGASKDIYLFFLASSIYEVQIG